MAIAVGTGLGSGHESRQHCEGSRPRADKLLIKPRRVGQVGAGSREEQVKRKAHPQAASVLESHPGLPTLTLPNQPSRAIPRLTVFSFVPRCQGECGSQK